jgi:internalin A
MPDYRATLIEMEWKPFLSGLADHMMKAVEDGRNGPSIRSCVIDKCIDEAYQLACAAFDEKIADPAGPNEAMLAVLEDITERLSHWQVSVGPTRGPADAPAVGPPSETATLPIAIKEHISPRTSGAEMAAQSSSEQISLYISYAWTDESKSVVNELCEAAEQRGIRIVRDETGIDLGESISQFMQRLGAGDRVCVVLSEKYLRSPNCMYELWEIWRNSKMRGEEFRRRIRVYRLKDAQMMTPSLRMSRANYWVREFKKLDARVSQHGAELLGESDHKRYRFMKELAHNIGDMLALIADTLLARDLEEFKRYVLGEETGLR